MKKIGLIGCGNWGKNVLRDLNSLGCQVYVADIDHQARSRAVASGARQAVLNVDDLPLCDGYVVAVPIPDLTTETARLLRLKRPIFAEKTLCLSEQDISLLKNSGGSDYIFCMHKWHYHSGIEALRRVALSGKIGEIEELYTIRHGWADDFYGGDVFWTFAVHDLTIIRHIIGHIPEQVKAINVIKNEEGLPVSLLVVLADKPVVVISTNGRHCHKKSSVSLHGKKGSATLDDAYDDHITVHTDEGEERVPIETTFPLFLELKEFVGYLDNGPKPRCNLDHAVEVTRAILGLKEKAGLIN
jgi:predicted dehydrogenase